MPEPLTPLLLQRVLSRILEDAAFVFTEPAESVCAAPPRAIIARLAFRGPQSGFLHLVLPLALSTEVAANLLGTEEAEISKEDAHDAVGELLNMTGGVLAEVWWGEEADCDLGLPQVEVGPWPTNEDATCLATLMTDDDHRVDLALHFDPTLRIDQPFTGMREA